MSVERGDGRAPEPLLCGIDSRWENAGSSFTRILVHAPCSAVELALREQPGYRGQLHDLLRGAVQIATDQEGKAICLFQLRGHKWTQIDGHPLIPDFKTGKAVSRRLETLVLMDAYEDTGGAYGYSVFNRGECTEEYFRLRRCPANHC